MFDIYTIIFLALAVFIFLRLRSVLGQRTGRERPPYDPYSARDAVRSPASDKVVTLPQRPAEPAVSGRPSRRRRRRIAGRAWPRAGRASRPGSTPSSAADPSFDAKHFITGARAAYEMIVTAFAEGDRRQLRSLLSREVYRRVRRRHQRTREPRRNRRDALRLDRRLDHHGAELRGRTAQITVRFVSKLISVTRDRSGDVIDGNAEKVTDVTDVWTFARDVSSRDPNWKVVATEAGQ